MHTATSCVVTPNGLKSSGGAFHFHALIVLGELRAGFAADDRESTNATNLQLFLNSPRVVVLLPDEQTTHHYAQLYLQLRNKGISIPTNDL